MKYCKFTLKLTKHVESFINTKGKRELTHTSRAALDFTIQRLYNSNKVKKSPTRYYFQIRNPNYNANAINYSGLVLPLTILYEVYSRVRYIVNDNLFNQDTKFAVEHEPPIRHFSDVTLG